jgi:acetyl-CoA carboxylase, biotin carboxylase subunit
MIAKLIVSGPDRPTTVRQLQGALAGFGIQGIATNLGLLRHIAAHPDFIDNRISTRWLEQVLLPSFASSSRSS